MVHPSAGTFVTPAKRQRSEVQDSDACITPETCVAPSKQIYLSNFGVAAEAVLDIAHKYPETTGLESSHAATLPMDAKARAKVEAAEAKERAKAHAKVEAERLRLERRAERKAALQEHRRQLEQRREQMAAHQAQMLKEAAERQRQRAAASASAPLAEEAADAAATATQQSVQLIPDSIETLVMQVLSRNCPFRCLGLKPGTPSEAVRKRYLALALRLHPDKAVHPRAQEAFSALERAYSRARKACDDF